MSLPLRHRVLAAAVLLTALATGYVASLPEDETPTAAIVTLPDRGRAPALVAASRDLWPAADPEALRAWGLGAAASPTAAEARRAPALRGAVAPAAVVTAPAAPPTAPEPPWRFIGRIDEAGQVRAMLAAAQTLRVVAERDKLDNDWQVEQIGEQAVDLLWLPGAQRVRLAWVSS